MPLPPPLGGIAGAAPIPPPPPLIVGGGCGRIFGGKAEAGTELEVWFEA